MTIHLVGDGLAGLLLARHLRELSHPVTVYGDGETNTPPAALVHLFAGRTFRRDEIELECFAEAVRTWRAEPLAQEYPVRRKLRSGERLERSLENAELPLQWRPRRLEDDWVEYSPGFSIASKALEERLRAELGESYRPGRQDWRELADLKILAVGIDAAEDFPEEPWDLSSGRTVQTQSEPGEHLIIGDGVHRAPFLSQQQEQTVILGGRSSPTSPRPQDEIEIATRLTGLRHAEISTWSGQRCAARDHRPVLGWLDPSTFLFLGFGSRALFWLPYCVKLAARALEGEPIDPQLDLARLERF